MLVALLTALGDYGALGYVGILHEVNYQPLAVIPYDCQPFSVTQRKYGNKSLVRVVVAAVQRHIFFNSLVVGESPNDEISMIPSSPECDLSWEVYEVFSSSKCTAPECPLAIGRDTNKPPLVCDTSRMEMRLLRETRSVFEYSFPRIAAGQVYQILSGNMETISNVITPLTVVIMLVSIVNLTTLVKAWLWKRSPPPLRRLVK